MPEEERPDWLICLDDVQALALLSSLACSLAPEKMPGAVVLCNLPSQFYYPVKKLILFNNNLKEFAKTAVNLLIKAMTSGNQETGQVFYLPCEYTN
jgi:DNA-binding LacI/PurR family transcriptional regulator